MTGCRCLGPPVHTCMDLGCTYPGVGTPSEVTLDQGVAQNAQNCYYLHNFNLASDPDLAFSDWFQVPEATCSGGGHLPTHAWALGNHRNPCRLLWTRLRNQNQPQIRGEKSPKMKVKIWKGVWVKTYCFLPSILFFLSKEMDFGAKSRFHSIAATFFCAPPKIKTKPKNALFNNKHLIKWARNHWK